VLGLVTEESLTTEAENGHILHLGSQVIIVTEGQVEERVTEGNRDKRSVTWRDL